MSAIHGLITARSFSHTGNTQYTLEWTPRTPSQLAAWLPQEEKKKTAKGTRRKSSREPEGVRAHPRQSRRTDERAVLSVTLRVPEIRLPAADRTLRSIRGKQAASLCCGGRLVCGHAIPGRAMGDVPDPSRAGTRRRREGAVRLAPRESRTWGRGSQS